MPKQASRWRWLPLNLALGAAMLAAQAQPQSQSPPQAPSQTQQAPQVSAQQQAIEALADQLIAAPNEEARNALLLANPDLVTADLARALGNTRGLKLLRAKTDLPKTRLVFEIALAVAQRINDKGQIAADLGNIGLVLKDQGDYESSLDYIRRSVAIYEELKDPRLAGAYSNIGIVHRLQGNYREAADDQLKALRLYENQGDKRGVATASFNLGNAYVVLGNNRLALEQYEKSMAISKELGLDLGIAFNTNALGILFESQGDYDLALSYYEQGLKLKEKAANQREIGSTLINLAVVYQEMRKPAAAREYLDKALNLDEASGFKAGMAEVQFNYGFMLRENGDYAGALERDRVSISLCEEIGDKDFLAASLTEIASTYYALKDYSRASESAQRAADIARSTGVTSTLSRALDIAGLALIKSGRPEEARAAFTEAVAVIEELRVQTAGAEEEQASILGKKIAPYHHMVQLLGSENKPAEAFEFAERAKARVLLDVMRSGRVHIDKAMTALENDGERKLVSRLAFLNLQISAEKAKPTPNAAHIAQLNADLDQARLDYRGFQTSLYTAHPELQVARGDVKPVSVAQVAPLLPDAKTALLEFLVSEDKTYLFVLVKGTDPNTPRLTAYTLPIGQKDLTTRVGRFREQLAARDPDYGESARALYRLLLRPARAALAGKTTIIIVPDGPLWELPFQALQSSAGHHLLQDAAISYAPSLTVLLEMLRRHGEDQSAAQRLLALGNPTFSKQDADRLIAQASLASNHDVGSGDTLRDLPADLPNARHEVAALSRLYGTRNSAIYTGAAATEQTFKTQAGKYDVVHLATHGVFDDRNPMYSYLLLAGPGTDAGEDGLLEAWEVTNLDLKADLVVLSACETARGKASSGEGLIGMSWAFFVAGSPALVASQWKVDSASTTELMLGFHRGLRYHTGPGAHSAPKAKALQQAALSVMEKTRYHHPFYWAGFVLIGDGL